MRIRAVILLALLLVSQLFGVSMASSGALSAPCGKDVAVAGSCCAPGHCHCKATPVKQDQPGTPLAPAPAEKDLLAAPVFLPVVEMTAPPAPQRGLAVSHISRVCRIAPPSVRRNALFCSFLI